MAWTPSEGRSTSNRSGVGDGDDGNDLGLSRNAGALEPSRLTIETSPLSSLILHTHLFPLLPTTRATGNDPAKKGRTEDETPAASLGSWKAMDKG